MFVVLKDGDFGRIVESWTSLLRNLNVSELIIQGHRTRAVFVIRARHIQEVHVGLVQLKSSGLILKNNELEFV